jgi:group I intron endonuclease
MTAHYTVYETTNLVNGKFYRGTHITDDIHDDYLGSGVALQAAIKKHGKENFTKRVFAWCANEENMKEIERLLVTEMEVNNRNCYNMTEGGGRPPVFYGDDNPAKREEVRAQFRGDRNAMRRPEVKRRHSERLADPAVKAKISAAKTGENNAMTGQRHTEETKAKMSAALTGRTLSKEHKAKLTGRIVSDESKAKMSAAQTGTIWINNGIINKRVPRDSKIPENFSLGRK